MTKITLVDLKVGQIWESRTKLQRKITEIEGDRITTIANNSHKRTAIHNLMPFKWGTSSHFITSCCAKLISEPNTFKFEDLKIGQVWSSVRDVQREIVTLGPKYVGLRLPSGHIASYSSDSLQLSNICYKEIKPVQKYWVNLFKSSNPEAIQAGQLYLAKCLADTSPSAANRIACIEVEFTEGEGCDG